jgi:hypothetical protein
LLLGEDESFEMMDLRPKDTGLPDLKIWISVNGWGRHKHPQLRVEWPGKIFYPLSLGKRPRFFAGRPPGLSKAQFRALQKFVAINRKVILAHWNDEIDSFDALKKIQRV